MFGEAIVKQLTAELVRDLAYLAGLKLELNRAEALVGALQPVFEGDAAITKLNLNLQSAVEAVLDGVKNG